MKIENKNVLIEISEKEVSNSFKKIGNIVSK